MKRTAIFSGAFLGTVVMTSAWGPQTPQLLVSDEIWQTVGKLLHDSEDVHFSLPVDDVMQRMSVLRDEEGGLFLMTRSIAVPTDASAHRLAMLEARQMVNSALASSIRNPARQGHACKAPDVQIDIAPLDRHSFEILMYEPISVIGSACKSQPEAPAESSSTRVDDGQQGVAYESAFTAAS